MRARSSERWYEPSSRDESREAQAASLAAEGENLWQFNCASCHGLAGEVIQTYEALGLEAVERARREFSEQLDPDADGMGNHDLMDDANVVVDSSTITSHIKRIRKKFVGVDPGFDRIETAYGMGYRWKPR